ncbi:MAG: C25 family cysteine peptidase [Planctomycetota bacterium]
MLSSICALLALSLPWSVIAQEPVEHYRNASAGLVFRSPGDRWKRSEGTAGASEYVLFDHRELASTRLSLQIWRDASKRQSLDDRCDQELDFSRSTGSVKELKRANRRLSGVPARSVRYRVGDVEVDATYARRDDTAIRLAVSVPVDRAADLERWIELSRGLLEWTRPEETAEAALEIGAPIPGNVVTLVPAGPDAAWRYLEALPSAARSNGGIPLVLVVGERWTETARDFIAKYRPERIRLLGELDGAHPGSEVVSTDEPGRPVVVSEKDWAIAIQATVIAIELDAGLIIDGADLEDRLKAISPSQVWVAGEVDLPDGVSARPLSEADVPEPRPYWALCNVADGRGQEVAVFAAALAAHHRGRVLTVDEPVRHYRGTLKETENRPPGVESSPLGRYLHGTVRLDSGEIAVAARVIDRLSIAGVESDRYDRPRLDLDGDGRFDGLDEQPDIGSAVHVEGGRFVFTARYPTALGWNGSGEALLMQPDARDISAQIREAIEAGGRGHLAIVGLPTRIPYFFQPAETYFSGLDIKQELASDAPYANLDEDPALEMATGRLLLTDLELGSAVLANTLAYERFSDEWTDEACLLAPSYASSERRGSLHWVWPESEALARSLMADFDAAGISVDAYLRDRGADVGSVLRSMAKAAWIGHMNHSNATAWGIRPGVHLMASQIPALESRPIVIDTGCSSAAFDLGTSLQSTWPGRFFSSGAVAYFGNTRPASLGCEPIVQEMIARVVGQGATLGEGWRDGWNLLRHLVDQGAIDPEIGVGLLDPGSATRLHSQLHNLTFFGDPGLRPRLPRAVERPFVDIRLEETEDPSRQRLIIERQSEVRDDPILMLAASGEGEPRETILKTASGLTHGTVPHFWLEDADPSPLRDPLAEPPSVWVDIPLPAAGKSVSVEAQGSPGWVDRGYSVERDPGGPSRLRMVVPMVQASLESGGGVALDRVEYLVTFSGPSGDPAPARVLEVPGHSSAAPPPRTSTRPSSEGRLAPEAAEIVGRVRSRIRPASLEGETWLLSAFGSDTLDSLRARVRFDDTEPGFDWEHCPAALTRHRDRAESELSKLMQWLGEDPFDLLHSQAFDVAVVHVEDDATVLGFRRVADEGDEEILAVISADDRIERLRRTRFGVTEEMQLTWRDTPGGLSLARVVTDDVLYGCPLVIEIERDEASVELSVGAPGIWPVRQGLRIEAIEGGR